MLHFSAVASFSHSLALLFALHYIKYYVELLTVLAAVVPGKRSCQHW